MNCVSYVFRQLKTVDMMIKLDALVPAPQKNLPDSPPVR